MISLIHSYYHSFLLILLFFQMMMHLFLIMWFYSRKPRLLGSISGLFLFSYGLLRFLAEFYREPDVHLGPVALGWISMGQALSLPMVLGGIALWVWAVRRKI